MKKERKGANKEMVFRAKMAQTGRHVFVTPGNSAAQHLAYGRIFLNDSKPFDLFSTDDRETGLICLSGQATVTLGAKEISLGRFDASYIPRDSSVKIATVSNVDIAEFSADVAECYPMHVIRYSAIETDARVRLKAV